MGKGRISIVNKGGNITIHQRLLFLNICWFSLYTFVILICYFFILFRFVNFVQFRFAQCRPFCLVKYIDFKRYWAFLGGVKSKWLTLPLYTLLNLFISAIN